MGILGWSPDQFWKASPWDLLAALRGWREVNCPREKGKPSPKERATARMLRRKLETYNEALAAKRKGKK